MAIEIIERDKLCHTFSKVVRQSLKTLPQYVIKKLRKHNARILLGHTMPSLRSDFGHKKSIPACFAQATTTIYMASIFYTPYDKRWKYNKDPGHLFHEIGHFFDHCVLTSKTQNRSSRSDFIHALNKDKAALRADDYKIFKEVFLNRRAKYFLMLKNHFEEKMLAPKSIKDGEIYAELWAQHYGQNSSMWMGLGKLMPNCAAIISKDIEKLECLNKHEPSRRTL